MSKAGKRPLSQDAEAQQHDPAADTAHEGDVVDQAEGVRADRRNRDLPPGLSERDAAILRSVKRRANVLDKRFKVCGAEFGWTLIIGIIPGVGDALLPAIGYVLVVHQARKAKIPRALTLRMILNLAISASIGIVPGIGDVLLAAYRANLRNARLLENFLRIRGERAATATQNIGSGSGHDKDDEPRGSRSEQAAEDHDRALPEMPLVVVSASQPAAASTSGGGDKGKSTAVAPDSTDGDDMSRLRRPERDNLEVVQRDSRFIEDVS